ncbi:phosphoribosyltransferase family protein [Vibrio sp. CAU 1672]|uniref:ComF family protein n=1 Tax=Vibrio sp. CAU 1672 TaxID=3032594 RepID=UPI0023DC27AD|nr:phosphoribosyltransferase family protein [Vibrio sp. CAU 1672]MDF2153982.1 phosphoribosyltransferase family protein [Vibrio sp. CAU 1672]
MLSHQWQNIMHQLFSSQCGLCHFPLPAKATPSNPLRWCRSCYALLAPQPRCIRCGIALPGTVSPQTCCGGCLTSPPPWQRLYTLGDYRFPLANEVQRLKDSGHLWHVPALAQLLASRIPAPAPLLTCVPLHWRRYLTRGFNQSDLLARHLARRLGSTYDHRLFRRSLHTTAQRGQDKNQRMHNLAHAFSLRHQPRGRHLAIVDDVVTTGSTVRQLCHLLLEAGVESIDIYCICRTPEPNAD